MRAPPDKRKTAPAGDRGGSKSDSCDGHIDNRQYTNVASIHQGKCSYDRPAGLVAVVSRVVSKLHAMETRHG